MEEKFLCPSKSVIDDMLLEGQNLLSKTNNQLLEKIKLKINGKKEDGYLVNAFKFGEDFFKDIQNGDPCQIFITDQFFKCFEAFLLDPKVFSIIIDVGELTGKVFPKEVKYKIKTISRVVSKKDITKNIVKVTATSVEV